MKIIYSEIKKWLPDLKDDAKSVRDNLTQIGHFVSGFEEIDSEIVLDLEIRSNRADCLSYYGIARELATFYNLDLQIPEIKSFQFSESSIPITINSPDVYRIQATKISNLKNSPSPSWLIKFLKLHDINSINTLVDLTNYVMLQWGIPCHAFDLKKSSELIWENNQNYSEFTSLDGSKIKLSPKNLLITDSQKVLSLSFIGGQNSSIDLNTTDSILEMAIYNPSRVRSDSRSLKTITEASIRLDKELDTQTIPLAFSHLLSLLITHCGAIISSQLLDIYPKVPSKITIEFDPSSPASYAGINIPTDFSLDVLKHLGCSIIKNLKSSLLISPPSLRKDLNLSEDLIEEVIRFYGYYKIPIDTPVDSQTLSDITPPILYLIENLKDQLLALGYDEIRSWPLVKTPLDKNAIFTQNSINSDYPVLRQSLIQSLKTQLDQYRRFKLPAPQFFEIGKIYFQKNGQYLEQNALAIYHYDSQKLESDLNLVAPVKGRYPKGRGVDSNFTEIILDDLPKPKKYLPTFSDSKAIELTSQIITLDANLNLDSPRDPLDLIKEYSTKINPKILWSIEIIDVYKNRYTFRVSYYNCDDKTAKKIHLSTFNLL